MRIKGTLDDLKQTMTTRTAMPWLQYLDMVSVLQRFIKAERMANWKLHIQTVQGMLPYFAASGHSLYEKSAYVYLQIMLRLPETHPDAHRKFKEGYHVVRRSGRIVHRPNHRASACEKYKDTWRADKRKGDERAKSVRCGSCPCLFVQASMRPCKSLAVYHMKPVTSTRMYQQLDKREMSVTQLI